MSTNEIRHEIKTCPRCGTGFECKAGTILQCQCYGIDLPEPVKQQIEYVFRDCLCRACLETLRNSGLADKPAE